MRTKYSEQDLIEAVKTSFSIADVCRKVGLKPVGGNYKTIKQKIIKLLVAIQNQKKNLLVVHLRSKANKEVPEWASFFVKNNVDL